MKVSTLSSVGAKLFYYMSALVLITVAGNSFQYIKTFMRYQTDQVQDSIQLQAEHTRDQFENTIETWRSQIAVSLPTLRGVDNKSASDQIQRFVDSNPEFITFEMLGAPTAKSTDLTPLGEAATSNTTDKNFDDKEPGKIIKHLRAVSQKWLKAEIPKMKKGNNVTIESVAKNVGLPVMLMAVRFDVANSQSVLWAVLATWQTNLIKSLPKSAFIDSAVVDSKGKVFTSPEPREMLARSTFPGKPLVASATKGSSPSGFQNEYRDTSGQRKLGAFARLPRYDLAVVVEQDAEQAYLTLRKNLLSTGLWALLFILIAVMFSFFGAAGITKSLRAVTYATGRIAAGDFKYQIPPASKDEVGMLGEAVNHMSRKIVDLMQSQVEKARFEKELETARMVQSTFFPKANIKTSDAVVTGFYEPASECGGDLWGHYTIEDGIEFVFIADAMGHGAPAALVTAMAYSTTMTIADIIRNDPGSFRDSPAKILARLNRIIYEAVRGTISMTFFASVLDTRTGKMTYANAGHNFPVIIPLNAGDPRAGKPTKQSAKTGGIWPITLKLMGTPLGMDLSTEYKEQSIELKPGDKIFYFTDGLIECSNPKGEVWGRKFLLEQVAAVAEMNADGMKEEVVSRAFRFFGGKPLDDDVTVVVAELARTWVARPAPGPASNAAPTKPASGALAGPPAMVTAAPAPSTAAQAPSAAPQAVSTAAGAPVASPSAPAVAPMTVAVNIFRLDDPAAPPIGKPVATPAPSAPTAPQSTAPTAAAPHREPASAVAGMPPAQPPPRQAVPVRPLVQAAAPSNIAMQPLAAPVSLPPRALDVPVSLPPQALNELTQPQAPAPAPKPASVAQSSSPGKAGKYKLKLPSTG